MKPLQYSSYTTTLSTTNHPVIDGNLHHTPQEDYVIDTLLVGSSNARRWAFPKRITHGRLKNINLGLSGALTSHLLTASYFDRMRHYCPKNVVYMCGNNDLRAGKTVHAIAQNILQFIIHAQTVYLSCNTKSRIVVCSLLHTPDTRDIRTLNAVNREISEFCKGLKKFGIVYVNINRGISADDFIRDGVHLNSSGYNKVYNTLLPYLV